jgi:hypothetical protein
MDGSPPAKPECPSCGARLEPTESACSRCGRIVLRGRGSEQLRPARAADWMSMTASTQSGPSVALVLVVSVTIALGDLATLFIFSIGCAAAENSPQEWLDFCNGDYAVLPALGFPLAIGAGIGARLLRRAWLLWLGAGLAAAAALSLWVLWGDPAGNFNGLLTSWKGTVDCEA